MEKYFLFVIIYFLSFLCPVANGQQPSRIFTPETVPEGVPCDSLSPKDFSAYDYLHFMGDTVINGTNYAFAVELSDRHIFTFREDHEKYGYRYVELLTDGVPSYIFSEEHARDYGEYTYYIDVLPSPSGKYVLFGEYYLVSMQRLEMDNPELDYTRFRYGHILDVERGKTVCGVYGTDFMGDWNYCDQWIAGDEIIFDPRDID